MTTNKHKIPVDQIQNLEIDRNGRVTPRLNDLDPLENTLLSVLYPGIRVASVNVPVEPLDEYEESLVENALAKLSGGAFTTNSWERVVPRRRVSFTLWTMSTAGLSPIGSSTGRRRRLSISGYLCPPAR